MNSGRSRPTRSTSIPPANLNAISFGQGGAANPQSELYVFQASYAPYEAPLVGTAPSGPPLTISDFSSDLQHPFLALLQQGSSEVDPPSLTFRRAYMVGADGRNPPGDLHGSNLASGKGTQGEDVSLEDFVDHSLLNTHDLVIEPSISPWGDPCNHDVQAEIRTKPAIPTLPPAHSPTNDAIVGTSSSNTYPKLYEFSNHNQHHTPFVEQSQALHTTPRNNHYSPPPNHISPFTASQSSNVPNEALWTSLGDTWPSISGLQGGSACATVSSASSVAVVQSYSSFGSLQPLDSEAQGTVVASNCPSIGFSSEVPLDNSGYTGVSYNLQLSEFNTTGGVESDTQTPYLDQRDSSTTPIINQHQPSLFDARATDNETFKLLGLARGVIEHGGPSPPPQETEHASSEETELGFQQPTSFCQKLTRREQIRKGLIDLDRYCRCRDRTKKPLRHWEEQCPDNLSRRPRLFCDLPRCTNKRGFLNEWNLQRHQRLAKSHQAKE